MTIYVVVSRPIGEGKCLFKLGYSKEYNPTARVNAARKLLLAAGFRPDYHWFCDGDMDLELAMHRHLSIHRADVPNLQGGSSKECYIVHLSVLIRVFRRYGAGVPHKVLKRDIEYRAKLREISRLKWARRRAWVSAILSRFFVWFKGLWPRLKRLDKKIKTSGIETVTRDATPEEMVQIRISQKRNRRVKRAKRSRKSES